MLQDAVAAAKVKLVDRTMSLRMQDKEVQQNIIVAAQEKLNPLIMLLPGQAATSNVATFLAESDNITRILKVYGDTLKESSVQTNVQKSQVGRLVFRHQAETLVENHCFAPLKRLTSKHQVLGAAEHTRGQSLPRIAHKWTVMSTITPPGLLIKS